MTTTQQTIETLERERDTLRAVLADVWSRWDREDTEDAPELAKRIEAALGLAHENA